ncbi:unnamed protein product [Periconia digitata]|uniref:Zn(2)-C6 fungal-type domain-containing protein n=1 Tax=Periconia digitata TaxID=1303443 RepID=A0A9W4XXT2_9PLEO|nr:unnamed protein product [Periconia digitata]
MGKYRSKSGCMTCRQRRVKCDEMHPTCGQCGKKNRDCRWEPAHSRFRSQQLGSTNRSSAGGSSSTTPVATEGNEEIGVDEEDAHFGPTASSSAVIASSPAQSSLSDGINRIHREGVHPSSTSEVDISTFEQKLTGKAPQALQQDSIPPFRSQLTSPTSSRSSGQTPIPVHASHTLPFREPIDVTHHEARLIHHYAQHLGSWLDGMCPARQFTLRIPRDVKNSPILLQATLCFAAHHAKDELLAKSAYQRCISLLIEHLNLEAITYDDTTLCAIVILRFYEQLNVPPKSGSDSAQHLAGSAAILRASQKTEIDPTAATLREASFWVYVRQCLYNSTIDQQPPNLDFTLRIEPHPVSLQDHHPLAQLRLETAWSNLITWHCACITNFCFDDTSDRTLRKEKWDRLWNDVQLWHRHRPSSFDPIWSGHDSSQSRFPLIYFTADWHVVSFGYYHVCCMLLLAFKPGPRFILKNVRAKPSENELQILEHAYALCGSCKSSPKTVPSLITLCHTVFIWAPLFTDSREQTELVEILSEFERDQTWPTTWIIDALNSEWGVE